MDVRSSAQCPGSCSHSRALPAAGDVYSIPPRYAGANYRAGYGRYQGRKPPRASFCRLGLTLALSQATVQLNNHFYKSNQCVPALFEIASTSPNAAVSYSPLHTAHFRGRRTSALASSQVGRKSCRRARWRLATRDAAAATRHLDRRRYNGDGLADAAALTRFCRRFT